MGYYHSFTSYLSVSLIILMFAYAPASNFVHGEQIISPSARLLYATHWDRD